MCPLVSIYLVVGWKLEAWLHRAPHEPAGRAKTVPKVAACPVALGVGVERDDLVEKLGCHSEG